MSKFESVNVVKAANVYFDGKVSSRTVEFSDGSTKTLGLMLPGEYTFNTGKPELMEITSGKVTYCLAGQDTWHEVSGGSSFDVPGESSFQIKVHEVTDYICSFLNG
ncbi:MAG: pyrimidine/purine nucleoside phosphorylase [Planctomycetaceae bacterium]